MMSATEKQADGTVAPNDEFSWPPLESNPDVFTVREKYIDATPIDTTYALSTYM